MTICISYTNCAVVCRYPTCPRRWSSNSWGSTDQKNLYIAVTHSGIT